MTARHIDVTDETNEGRIVKIMWNEANEEQELTVRMPSAEKGDVSDVDVNLMQIPGEEPGATLDHAISVLEDLLGGNEHIHIDGNDIKDICTGASTAVIRVEGVSTDTIGDAFDERLSASGIKADAITGAVISIEGPEEFHLTEAMTVVHGIQHRLTDEAGCHRMGAEPHRHRYATCHHIARGAAGTVRRDNKNSYGQLGPPIDLKSKHCGDVRQSQTNVPTT